VPGRRSRPPPAGTRAAAGDATIGCVLTAAGPARRQGSRPRRWFRRTRTGEQLRALLTEALNASLAADRSFVLWGQAVQGSGCDGGGRDDHREAQRQSRLAGDAKSRFVAVWNLVAARHGLRERSATEI
jgi:hypothetical protein